MWPLLISAVNTALGWVFRTVILRFVIYSALYFLISDLIGVLSSYLPAASTVSAGLAGISSDVWYFLDLFCFSQGAPLVLSAYAVRFIIRRLPVIG